MAVRPPRNAFWPKRTVRLVVDDDMTLDTLGIVRSLSTFQEDIVGIVPQFGGKCYDITLKNVESVTWLTTAGFDYEQKVIPMRLLGPKILRVCFRSGRIPGRGTYHYPPFLQHSEIYLV